MLVKGFFKKIVPSLPVAHIYYALFYKMKNYEPYFAIFK